MVDEAWLAEKNEDVLTRLGSLRFALPRGAKRIKEATMICAYNARPIILYMGAYCASPNPHIQNRKYRQ